MEILFDIFVVMFNILGWSIPPFINKNLLKSMDPLSFTVLRWILSIPFALLLAPFFKNIYSQKSTFYITVFALLILSFLTAIAQNYLLKKYNANIVTAIISPLVIFFTAIFGNLLFNEPFTQQMWIGLLFILIGLIIFILGRKDIKKG
jgi:drug/metabolite transporter (DMT)-like permease